jgi:membrane fusion protein (multidrug efflux system)
MSVLSYVAAIGLSRAALPRNAAGRVPLRRTVKRSLLSVAILAGLGIAADQGRDYWTLGRFHQSTDNAYLRADYTTVAPRLSGYIVEVQVHDNEAVRAGQVLARIDDRDFRAALDQASADVDMADAVLGNLDAQIVQQQAVLDQERADIAAGKATLAYARADNQRYDDLKKSGYGSVQRAQQAEMEMRERMAQLRKSRAALLTAERHIDVLASERLRAVAQRERSLAARRQAELNLSYTSIVAPVDGTIGARSLRVGQFVQTGTPLMAVVPLEHIYVVANYKETQLAGVRAGQPVSVEIDSFPGLSIKGHVDSVAPASGQEFSLLPADNATGNFTKIVQRVPVRIALDDTSLLGRLRPGMSARTTIDTRAN